MSDKADHWMTVSELSEYLQLSRAKLYGMAQANAIPCSKVANQWRFLSSEIDDWLRSSRPTLESAHKTPYFVRRTAHVPQTGLSEPLVMVCGKFQPFHLEHLEYVLAAFQEGDHVLIGITNPDPGYVRDEVADPKRSLSTSNPFSYYERYRMVVESLSDQGIQRDRYDVLPFPLNVPGSWFAYVPRKTVVLVTLYNDDPWLEERRKKLEQGGLRTKVLWGKDAKGITGTEVRAALTHQSNWMKLVPTGTSRVIRQEGLLGRLRE
ncbi:MAG: helix-turn-helix domain-containing protein [Sedimenticola sp.]